MQNKPNIDRITRVLSEILSDKHGVKVTIEAVPLKPERKETGESA